MSAWEADALDTKLQSEKVAYEGTILVANRRPETAQALEHTKGLMGRVSGEAIKMKKHHIVENVIIQNGVFSLVVDGKQIKRELKGISPLLAGATEEELEEFEISPSGYGVHWPRIDEDISIDGLLGIVHKPDIGKKSA